MPLPSILIAMPLFQGWEHVGETLASIKRQTYQNYRVLISVDGQDQRSYEACLPHIADSRFHIVLQSSRLLWSGNLTWLGEKLQEDFFCYWQHDDVCAPNYLEKLIEHAVRHPHASSIYCDMQLSGTMDAVIKDPSLDTVIREPSTTGFALQRVLRQIENFNPAVIRCLIRSDALRAALPIKLVYTWGMTVARLGELHRVPEVLYFRNIRPDSLSYTLRQRPAADLWQDSLDWALGAFENLHLLTKESEHDRVFAYIVDKLINQLIQKNWLYNFEHADRTTRLRFVREFLSLAKARFGSSPWPELDRNDALSFLMSRRARDGKLPGEELIINALLEAHHAI